MQPILIIAERHGNWYQHVEEPLVYSRLQNLRLG